MRYFLLFDVKEWMDEELKSKGMNFLAYLVKIQHPQKSGVLPMQMDVMLLVLFVQME